MEIYYEDPYLKELKTKVLEKGRSGNYFFVVPEKNLFYPGGGGQPADSGYANGMRIIKIEKTEGKIYYFLEKEFFEEEICLSLDFKKRYSFMQNHTAQHLITAISDKNFNLKTISFHLGEGYGTIDLEGDYNNEILEKIENQANELIKKGLPLKFYFIKPEEIEKMEIRSRGLPENFEGLVRIVEIEGIDKNTCGGLHVKNLSEIQMVKITREEKIKEGVRIYFKAGDSLFEFLKEKLREEEKIKEILNCSPEEFLKVLKAWDEEKGNLRRNFKKIKESFLKFLEEEKEFYFFGGADIEFLQKIGNFLSRKNKEKTFSLVSEDGENFYFLIIEGEESKVKAEDIFKKIKENLNVRGGGKGKVFQGKGNLGPDFDRIINLLKN